MMNVEVNYLAVLAAGIVNMFVGYFWYSPMLFGKAWMESIGMNEKKMSEAMKTNMGVTYGVMFVGALLMAYVLKHMLSFANATTITAGIQGGFWIWLGFIVPVMLTGVLFERKPIKWYTITVGYYLVILLVNSALLAVWK